MTTVNRSRRRHMVLGLLAGASTLALAACSGTSTSAQNKGPSGPPHQGGKLTVLELGSFAGGYPTGLDPATNTTGGANVSQMQAIYGGLFLLEADQGGKAAIAPNQAASYAYSDGGKTLTIKLRSGIRFSDGTAFDASAVAFNFQRDSTSSCTCAPQWQLAKAKPFETPDAQTVVVHLARPNTSIVNSFPASNVNWIISPTALKKQHEAAMKVKPIGAGPFVVVSDQLSSQLVLKRNPSYFKPKRPYLDSLTFKSVEGDQAAYQALQAGQGDVYEGMSTTPLISQAESNSRFVTTSMPPTSPYVIQLNTKTAPFNNKLARQAIYWATDFQAIGKGLFGGKYPISQSFVAPGGLFYHEKVSGYPTFDLSKAKAAVKQLGGLTVNLGTLNAYTANKVMTALQTQWQKAGIKVTTNNYQLSTLIEQFTGGKWQSMLQTAGAWDPAAGVGVAFRFSSTSPFSGVKDPKLDAMFSEGTSTTSAAQRDAIYQRAGEYIAQNAYGVFGLAFAPANIVVKGVTGPGLTSKIPALVVNSGVIWDQVGRTSG